MLATYYGNNTYKTATGTTTFTVASPGISVAVTPTTLSATYGSNATGTLTVTSGSSASGTTSFALSLVSYTGATFTGCYGLSARTLSLPANGSASATLTLYTNATSCTSAGLIPLTTAALPAAGTTVAWGNSRYGALAALPLPLLLLLLRRRRVPAALLAVVGLACGLGLSGCGSSSSTTTTTPTGTGTGTTTTSTGNTGSYVIRVTASTAASSGTLTSSTTFTLNVQ